MTFGGDLCALGTPSGMGWCRHAQEAPSMMPRCIPGARSGWGPLGGQGRRGVGGLEEAEIWDLGPWEHAIAPTVHEVAAQRLFSRDFSADL